MVQLLGRRASRAPAPSRLFLRAHKGFRLGVAVALIAVAPVAARADESLTATTVDTHTVTAPVVAPPIVNIAEQIHTMTLIEMRAARLALPAQSGEVAMNADGTTLWKHRPSAALMPASTMKIITATVALNLLGPSWKPVTSVDFDTATGTLTLVGGGDPALTSTQIDTLAATTVETLTAMGLTPTRLTIDDSLFPAPSRQPGVYASQQPVEERPIRALVVDQRKVADTGLDAGKIFRRALAANGVLIPFAGRAVSTGTRISAISGYTLKSTLHEMLLYSVNDIAEMTFRLSSIAAGNGATWADARANALAQLTQLGVPTQGLHLVDGAGLSRNNRMTPLAVADTLRVAALHPRTQVLRSLLPKAGVNGTLKLRYTTAPSKCVRGSLTAKTGTLHDVIALAGYAPAKFGVTRPFAIIINGVRNSEPVHVKTRLAIDGLAASFAGC